MNRPKMKGTAAESAFVAYLRRTGFPYAERRSLAGSQDMGDVTGCPGLVFEVKDCARWTIPAWLRETERERVNAGADYGLLVMKPPRVGLPDPGRWAAAMWHHDLARLMIQGGSSMFDLVEYVGSQTEHVRRTFATSAYGRVLVVKPRGVEDRDLYYCFLRVSDLVFGLAKAGYGRLGEQGS